MFVDQGKSEHVGVRCEVRSLLKGIFLPRVLRVRLHQELRKESVTSSTAMQTESRIYCWELGILGLCEKRQSFTRRCDIETTLGAFNAISFLCL